MTNLTNLIQSAGLANVDLKKLNEAVQNGQSFEDVLKGIVEELRAKANPDAASGADKKSTNQITLKLKHRKKIRR